MSTSIFTTGRVSGQKHCNGVERHRDDVVTMFPLTSFVGLSCFKFFFGNTIQRTRRLHVFFNKKHFL